PGVTEPRDGIAHGEVAVFGDGENLRCREAVQPDLRKALLDAAQQTLEPVDFQIGMQPALHQHAGAAHLERLGDLRVDRIEVEYVAFARYLAFERTVKRAEGTVLRAEVRIVNISVDNVRDHAFRVQPLADGIRLHAQTNQVVGVEIIEGLLTSQRHRSILGKKAHHVQLRTQASDPGPRAATLRMLQRIAGCVTESFQGPHSRGAVFMRNISSRCFCAGLCLLLNLPLPIALQAQDKNTPDTLVLTDGNTLRGKLVKEVSGTLTFHTEALGDLDVKWANVKELHTTQSFAVLNKNMKRRSKTAVESLPMGQVNATSESVTVQPSQQQRVLETIPVKNAEVIVDQGTLDKELNHEPGFLTGWNGAATAGATLVKATQNQYTFSGSVGLMRMVPTVSWLDTRNRSSLDFSDSFGKITQPAYTVGGVTTPATSTKSSILHFDAERDQYFSPRLFALVQTAFDHNFSQDLNLQQIYGGGL